MPTVALMPEPRIQFFNSTGTAPLAGGKVYTYQPGTTTPKATYTDSTGLTANANPVVLDSNGMASIWLDGYYKISVTDSTGAVQTGYPVDNVSAMPSQSSTVNEYSTQSFAVTFATGIANIGSSFTCPADQTSIFVTGRRLKFVDTTTLYGTVVSSSYSNPTTTVNVTVDNGGVLSLGLSSVAVGLLMPTNQSLPYPLTFNVKEGDQAKISSDTSITREGSATLTTTVTLSGTTDGASNVTGLSSTAGLSVGMLATGTYIGAAPNRIATIVSSTAVTLSGTTSAGTANITFTSSLYSLLGEQAQWYRSHNFPIDIHGCFGARDETHAGQLQVLTESGLWKNYAVASGTAGVIPVASDFTLTSAFDLNTPTAQEKLNNKIINPGMLIDQRNNGAAQTITAGAALAYTVDRWYAYCTGANVTGQQVAGSAQTQKRYQFTGAASVTGIGFGTRLEQKDTYELNGQTCTLSVDLSNSLLTTVNWTAFYANSADTFGTLASPTRTQIATGSFTVTSTLTRYNAQIAIPAAATTGIEVVFTVGAQTSGTWVIGNADLRAGAVSVPFGGRAYIQELGLCQRYYFSDLGGYGPAMQAYCAASAYYFQTIPFPVPMRISPTVTKVGTYTVSNSAQPVLLGQSPISYVFGAIATASGNAQYSVNGAAGVGITASAEL